MGTFYRLNRTFVINDLFLQRKSFTIRFIFFVVLSLVLMIVDHRQALFDASRDYFSLLVSPLHYAVDTPVKMTNWLVRTFTSNKQLRRENARLKSQQLILKNQLQYYLILENENKMLRALLQATPRVEGEVTVAELLAVDLAPFSRQVILDRGSLKGVYEGQPVFDAEGVLGQVIETTPLTSRVLLITDERSAVPVQVARNGLRAIAKGTGSEKRLVLANVPKTADIQVGDILLTSGLGLRFPQGYPVGMVSSVHYQPGQEFSQVTVKPAAQINRSRVVLLVWPTDHEKLLREHYFRYYTDDRRRK